MAELSERGERLAQTLIKKIGNRSAKVAVIGLGYVGLPMAVELSRSGFAVIGIDKDLKKVEQINAGKSYILDVSEEVLCSLVKKNILTASHQYSLLREADIVIICVPTPLQSFKQPDLSFIISAARETAKSLKPGQLISMESTTFPGTTEEVILPILESVGLTVGRDFFLAFSPERVDPGNAEYSTREITKIVGGVTPLCQEVSCLFYQQFLSTVLPVSSPAAAEMTKILENTYRSVNIALVNEFMFLCDRMGLDIWEVVNAASTKPFGMHSFYPGPGVGGHCIPVDPFYLAWKAKDYDFCTRFIELASEINTQASQFVVQKLVSALNKQQKCLNGSKILVLGVAYKKDIDDVRESPAIKIISQLVKNKAEVVYYDPYVPQFRFFDKEEKILHRVDLTEAALSRTDCVLIITDHTNVDYQWVADHAGLILDTRNATKNVQKGREKIIKI